MSYFKYFLLLIALCANAKVAAQEVQPEFNTFLTATAIDNIPGSTPEKHYTCSDKIYAVIEVTAPERQIASKHQLVVNWFDPSKKLEQKTRYEFTSYGMGTRIWAWLKLSGPTGAAIGRIFDPAFGMGKFIGDWKVEILIDDKKAGFHEFDVLC